MDLRVDPSRDLPPCRQIVEAVLDAVAAGRMGVGDRLPSVRGLAAESLVNPNPVGKAYRDLDAMGVVAGRSGDGVFVTEGGPEIARAARRGATLTAVRDAVRAAVRAGHDPVRVREETERVLGSAERQSGAVSRGGRR
jgi:GntR family transcriptional regulator